MNDLVWDEEVDNLDESTNQSDYFKPEEGKQEITFLDEGRVYRDQKKFDDDQTTYVEFRIEVDGEKKVWDMKKGSTPGSKFGQIARFAESVGGLEGETVTWYRQGTGQQTNHILMDLDDEIDEEDGDEDSDNVILKDDGSD
jgi:hypothetical protein